MTGKSSLIKTPRKPILKTPTRPTPKALTTRKSVKIQSKTVNDMPTPVPNPTMMGTPVSVYGGAWPKIHRVDGTPLIPPTALTSPSPLQPLVPRRILSSTPSGENGEEVDKKCTASRDIGEKRKILMGQNRKIFHPCPIEGIEIGVTAKARDTGS